MKMGEKHFGKGHKVPWKQMEVKWFRVSVFSIIVNGSVSVVPRMSKGIDNGPQRTTRQHPFFLMLFIGGDS